MSEFVSCQKRAKNQYHYYVEVRQWTDWRKKIRFEVYYCVHTDQEEQKARKIPCCSRKVLANIKQAICLFIFFSFQRSYTGEEEDDHEDGDGEGDGDGDGGEPEGRHNLGDEDGERRKQTSN